MTEHWLDRLARGMTSRRGLARLGAGGALAALGLAPDEVAAACQAPKRPCEKGRQCCTKRCKNEKCAPCPSGARFLPAPDLLCWLSWGSFGSGKGQFSFPEGVAVGSTGNVYVADTGNSRIQQFSAGGGFIRTWGSSGPGNGQFNQPYGVAVAGNGDVYVADSGNHRIQQFTATGSFARTWGSEGSSNGQFKSPSGVAVAGNGTVYVADSGNHRIQQFTATGTFIRQWGSVGEGNGEFQNPQGVAAGNGHIYVADTGNHRVVRVRPL